MIESMPSGLNLLNDPSTRATEDFIPPGVFFLRREPEGVIKSSEKWAIVMGKQMNRAPFVIDITVTEENFPILSGRIYDIRINTVRPNKPEDYTRIDNFSDLNNPSVSVAIDLSGLAHEDLVELGVIVGFTGDDGNFEYRSYKSWTDEVGVHAPTREELRSSGEGRLHSSLFKKIEVRINSFTFSTSVAL